MKARSLWQISPVNKYKTKSAALKTAVAERDRQMLLLTDSPEKFFSQKKDFTVDELYKLVASEFPRRVQTHKNHDKVYKKYIQPKYGNKSIKDIQRTDITKTMRKCAATCTQTSVNRVRTIWHKIYQVAQIKGLYIVDLTTIIDRVESDHVTERSLTEQNITEEDFNKFCDAMAEYGHYLPDQEKQIYNRDILLYMLKFMRPTGVRPQEAKAVSKSRITFETVPPAEEGDDPVLVAYVPIVRSIGSSSTDELTVRNTKTKQSRRTVVLYGDDAKPLQEAINYSKYDLLFADYDGNPFAVNAVSDMYYRVSKACGIKVYAYLMRKSFSADAYREHENPAAVMKALGQKSAIMALEHYATVNTDDAQEIVKNRKYKK